MEFQEAPRKTSGGSGDDDNVWSPKVKGHGPLVGTVTERTGGLVSKFGGTGEVLKVVDDDGIEWTVLAFATRLLDCLEHFDPQVGDCVGISYEGSESTKSGNTIDNYKMGVERGTKSPAAAAAAPASPATGTDTDLPF